MTIKIPEVVILKLQKDIYDIHREYALAKRKVGEVKTALASAESQLTYAETNLRETCKFLDEVSPTGKDWGWLEEIDDELIVADEEKTNEKLN